MKSFASKMVMLLMLASVVCSPVACRRGGPGAEAIREPDAPTEPAVEATPEADAPTSRPSATPRSAPTRQPETDESNAEGDSEADVSVISLCDEMRGDLFRDGLIRPAQDVLDGLPGASVYEIDVEISDDVLSLEGHQEVCYTNREDEPLDEIFFRLFPNLLGGAATVSALRVDGQDVEPVYELADSALRVPLDVGLQPGEAILIEMAFEVEVAQVMERNYGLFGFFDGVLSLHQFYPVIPVYDDEGWNVELPSPQGDITYYDASFYRVQVTGPDSLVVVASGVEMAREEEGGSQVLTFAAGPARGFYVAASEDYVVASDTVGETQVNSYAPAGREEAADLALGFATDALACYSERFGVYPYTEFDVVSTPMLALGMEYPGMTAITREVYDLDATVRGVPAPIMMEGTVGHEVAHQWFYNMVGNDQIDEPWLDEAVVQYVTGLYYRDTYGEQGYQGWRGSWIDRWDRVDQAEIPIGLPVAAYEDGAYSAIVYGRGPLFVEALAAEMGQETFEAFLRDYVQSHAWGIGTGEAFRQFAEEHCQCDLSALFDEWVYPEDHTVAPTASRQTTDGEEVKGWAVLAQKDDYSDVDMTDLPVDHIGIKKMRQVLEDSGWDPDQIQDVEEFDRETLQDGLDWLEENAAVDDLVLVYVAAHGRYLRDVLVWDDFFPKEWEEVPSRRRVLVIDSCQAANYTDAVRSDRASYVSIAAVDGDEYGWSGLEEEGLPIIGGVFTHYFAAAFADGSSDGDGDGCVSVQEAALLAEEQQRRYIQDVVFAVPEFVEMYHRGGSFPDEDPTFPDVIIDDAVGEPVCLTLDWYR
jgi:hypothetical protein